MRPHVVCVHLPTGQTVITDMIDLETGEIVILPGEIHTEEEYEEWWATAVVFTAPFHELRPIAFRAI